MSYRLPVSRAFAAPSSSLNKKRKRGVRADQDLTLPGEDEPVPEENVEYTAVLTPLERVQRRLAGQALNELPPDRPFPHAPDKRDLYSTRPSHWTQEERRSPLHAPIFAVKYQSETTTLRQQHVNNLTSLIHTLIQGQDYTRAARVLSLLLRTPIAGQTIDIRNGGLWQIGAEILLPTPLHGTARGNDSLRPAFKRVKTFYDQLARQYPWHRSWPGATNAQDFKLATFNLWIWVIVQESKQMQTRTASTSPLTVSTANAENAPDSNGDANIEEEAAAAAAHVQAAKRHELSEATVLAHEMDSLMNTIPFIDDPELIRLRGHVALWTADILEAIADEHESSSEPDTNEDLDRTFQSQVLGQLHQQHEQEEKGEDSLSLHTSGAELEEPAGNERSETSRANLERQKAAQMFSKLARREAQHDDDDDNNDDTNDRFQ